MVIADSGVVLVLSPCFFSRNQLHAYVLIRLPNAKRMLSITSHYFLGCSLLSLDDQMTVKNSDGRFSAVCGGLPERVTVERQYAEELRGHGLERDGCVPRTPGIDRMA